MKRLVLTLLLLSLSLCTHAQQRPYLITVPPLAFAGFTVQGSAYLTENFELKPSAFVFTASLTQTRLRVTGLIISGGTTAYVTVYFGDEILTSDYVQVWGAVEARGNLWHIRATRVTALRLFGVEIVP